MKRSDLAEAHRALLEDFLSEVEQALKHRDDEIIRLCSSEGKSVIPPPLELHRCSQDTLKLVTEGLRATLNGNSDPFGLKTGSNHSRARSKKVRSETLEKVLKLNRDGISLDEACAKCVPNGVSSDTVKGWLKNKDERAWVEMGLDTYQRRRKDALSAFPTIFDYQNK